MTSVAIVGNGSKAKVREAAGEVRDWLSGRAENPLFDLEGRADLSSLEADVLLVFGGDGSILSAARRLNGRPVPVMGVNFGKVGFIAEYNLDEIRGALESVFAGEAVASSRMMLEIASPAGSGMAGRALNDVVILRGANPRMIYIELTLDGERKLQYAGDGLVVSTPTGSTAHSLTAGGPILTPEMKGVVLTPICAQALTTRPLVIPADTQLEIRVQMEGPSGTLTLDGQTCCEIGDGDVLRVEARPDAFRLLRAPGRGFLGILKEKLSWGVLPLYRERFRDEGGSAPD